MAIQLFNLECSLDKQVSIESIYFFFFWFQYSVRKGYYSQPKIKPKFARFLYLVFNWVHMLYSLSCDYLIRCKQFIRAFVSISSIL